MQAFLVIDGKPLIERILAVYRKLFRNSSSSPTRPWTMSFMIAAS